MRLTISWIILLAAGAAQAADDAAVTLQKVQAAWLRGASQELAQQADTAARWSGSAVAAEQYALAFAQFRRLQDAVARKQPDIAGRAGEACTVAAAKAAELAKSGALAAEARALQSTCYGYLAGQGGTFAAIRNGRASGKAMEQALAIDPRNARVLLVDGLGLYFRPKIAGGDKAKACTRMREAAAAFERFTPALGAWGQAETHYWIGRCLLDAKDAAAARREFETALRLAPEFAAARRRLAPGN